MLPTLEQMQNECKVIDVNGDARGSYNQWSFMEYFGAAVYWANNPAGDADDWLIFPAINITDVSKALKVSLDATATAEGTAESLEVRVGTAPSVEALTQVVMSEPSIPHKSNDEFSHYSSLFSLNTPGIYYVGVRCTSSLKSGWRLALKNLRLEQGSDVAGVPDGCVGLTAVPDPSGALFMTVSFTMPSKSISGTALPSSVKMNAVITTPAGSKTVQAAPGETVEEVLPAVDGVNVVNVEVNNSMGEGSRRVTTARCGIDIPSSPVVKSEVSDDNLTCTITWDPVTTGVNGGIVDPDGITYSVYRYQDEGSWLEVVSDCKDFKYSVTVPKGTVLTYCDLAVSASNAKGTADDASVITEIIGEPYKLPVSEAFNGGESHYQGLSVDANSDEYQGRFAMGDPSQLDPMFAGRAAAVLGMSEIETGTRGLVKLPKVSTKGKSNVQLTLPIFVYSAGPAIDVYAKTNDGRQYLLGTVDQSLNTGWTDLIYNFPAELYDLACVGVHLDIKYDNNTSFFVLGGYNMAEGKISDMALSYLSVDPVVLEIGKKASVTAKVYNRGMNPQKAPALEGTVSRSGNAAPVKLTFAPADPNAEIAVGDYMTYTAEFTLDTADYADTSVTVSACITTPDADAGNDRMTVEAQVAGVAYPLITDLSAAFVEEDGSIALSWSDPVKDEAVETFENYPSFTYESHLGPWTNLDFDMAAPYTLAEVEGVSIPDDTEPKAFQVVSAAESNLAYYSIYGYNGSDKMLMAFSPVDAAADDWLISPRIKGGFEVSFMWSTISSDYPETIEILYSTTANDVDSFNGVAARLTKKTTAWEEACVQIPEDARYFAIHYVSNDCFGIMIDDIIYYPETPEYELQSYAVLRDNVKIATLPADATSYNDKTVEQGAEYTYHVQPTFIHNGLETEGVRSNAVVLVAAGIEDVTAALAGIYGTTGAIIIKGCEGKTFKICDVAGRVLRTVVPASSLHVEPMEAGLYILDGVKAVVK